jgi:hypothetical protein
VFGIAPRIRFINEISVKKPIDHVMEKHSELIAKENLKQRRNLSETHQPDSSGLICRLPIANPECKVDRARLE